MAEQKLLKGQGFNIKGERNLPKAGSNEQFIRDHFFKLLTADLERNCNVYSPDEDKDLRDLCDERKKNAQEWKNKTAEEKKTGKDAEIEKLIAYDKRRRELTGLHPARSPSLASNQKIVLRDRLPTINDISPGFIYIWQITKVNGTNVPKEYVGYAPTSLIDYDIDNENTNLSSENEKRVAELYWSGKYVNGELIFVNDSQMRVLIGDHERWPIIPKENILRFEWTINDKYIHIFVNKYYKAPDSSGDGTVVPIFVVSVNGYILDKEQDVTSTKERIRNIYSSLVGQDELVYADCNTYKKIESEIPDLLNSQGIETDNFLRNIVVNDYKNILTGIKQEMSTFKHTGQRFRPCSEETKSSLSSGARGAPVRASKGCVTPNPILNLRTQRENQYKSLKGAGATGDRNILRTPDGSNFGGPMRLLRKEQCAQGGTIFPQGGLIPPDLPGRKTCYDQNDPTICAPDELCSVKSGNCIKDTEANRAGKWILQRGNTQVVGDKKMIEVLYKIFEDIGGVSMHCANAKPCPGSSETTISSTAKAAPPKKMEAETITIPDVPSESEAPSPAPAKKSRVSSVPGQFRWNCTVGAYVDENTDLIIDPVSRKIFAEMQGMCPGPLSPASFANIPEDMRYSNCPISERRIEALITKGQRYYKEKQEMYINTNCSIEFGWSDAFEVYLNDTDNLVIDKCSGKIIGYIDTNSKSPNPKPFTESMVKKYGAHLFYKNGKKLGMRTFEELLEQNRLYHDQNPNEGTLEDSKDVVGKDRYSVEFPGSEKKSKKGKKSKAKKSANCDPCYEETEPEESECEDEDDPFATTGKGSSAQESISKHARGLSTNPTPEAVKSDILRMFQNCIGASKK